MSGPKLNGDRRSRYGTIFGGQAELYDRVRPDYPERCLAWLAELARGRVCDLGAGTGKLGGALAARTGAEVLAVDPDAALLALNPCESLVGTGESIPLDNATISLVTVAQAWHWLDPRAAGAEILRVLETGGHLAIVNNQLDVRFDWVLRLSRIMHAGDVYRPAWRPMLPTGFGPVRADLVEFTQRVTVEQIAQLARTRTYWLRASPVVRARVEANLVEYLTGEALDDPGFVKAQRGGEIELPYMCLVYTAAKLR